MEFARNDNGELVIDADAAAYLIPILLELHTEESDAYAAPLCQLLYNHGTEIKSAGDYNLDYQGLIEFDGEQWLVEANNAWHAVREPSDHPDALSELEDRIAAIAAE